AERGVAPFPAVGRVLGVPGLMGAEEVAEAEVDQPDGRRGTGRAGAPGQFTAHVVHLSGLDARGRQPEPRPPRAAGPVPATPLPGRKPVRLPRPRSPTRCRRSVLITAASPASHA